MISIILPVLNEAENLKILIPELKKQLKQQKYEIIVVDDDSQDNTQAVIIKLKKQYPIIYILRKNKKSLSSAVIDGYNIAKGKYYIVMDSDLSHPPEVIKRIVRKLDEGYDIAVASRYARGGGVVKWAWFRKAVSYMGTFMARPIVKVKDPLAGYYGIKKQVIEGVSLNALGFKILLEVLVKGHYKKVTEIPYIFLERHAGQSKAGIRVYFQYHLHVFMLYLYIIKKFFKKVI